MKRLIYLVTFILCLSLTACGSSENASALSAKYDFYTSSINGLKTATGLSGDEADSVFETLAGKCGVDSFFIVNKNASDNSYSINYKLKTLTVFLDGSTVSKVLDGKDQIYPEAVLHNFLMDKKLTEKDVLSGSGDVLGKYAYIRVTSKQFKNITPDMLKEFAESVVDNSGYNWFSIIAPSNVGICFSGSDISSAFSGKIDGDGSILDADGMWLRDDNGNYTYTTDID